MPRAPTHARLCVVGVSLRPLSGLAPELRGEADQAMPFGETSAGGCTPHPTANLTHRTPRHPYNGLSVSVRLDGGGQGADVSSKWAGRLVKIHCS